MCCGLLGSIVTIVVAILLFIPMMIADPGSIFFRQERVGRNGRKFKIWKFRTMHRDAEARKAELMAQNKMNGLMFKMDDDPR
ncbi:MAG: sugar transferase, partial [Clostridiales bacterium]|nr:sugar transferase [Clostridiales bacterium]